MAKYTIALTIIISIILTILIVSVTNVGMSIIKESPQWDDYCDFKTQEVVETQDRCEVLGGEWNPEGVTYPREVVQPKPAIEGYCDLQAECRAEYDTAQESYNQLRFYVFAGLGFILLISGLFAAAPMLQWTGLGTGAILLVEGVVINLENKVLVFFSLLLILLIFGLVAWRIVNKHERKN